MAKISFYLTNPRAKSETPLFCFINYGLYSIESGKKKYLPLKYYTTISIRPDLWNKELNRAKESNKWAEPDTFDISIEAVKKSAKENYNAINKKIEDFISTTKKLINDLTTDGIPPTHEKLRIELDRIHRPEKVVTTCEIPRELFSFIDYLIQTSNNKQSTLKSYKVVKKNLQDYQSAKKIALTFNSIDIDFYNSFIEFLTKSGLSKNTIGTRIKILKTFLSEANDRGINVPDDYRKRTFKKPNEETDSIYLNEKELMQIFNLEKNPKSIEIISREHHSDKLPEYLTKVRDLFLVGCYTGLRFSDLTQLRKENITAEETINIKTQKTNQNVVVPIHPITRQILEKYNYQLPGAISNQKFNVYLKDIARIAGINEQITTEITKAGFKVATTTEKYNLVTSHTARRSFATNAFLADMPSISIMKITGHKTESAFMKYIKMSAKDNATKMKSHKFFNPMLIAK